MNKFLLYMVMLLSGLWESLGADIDQLKAILKVRLMLDDRKPMTLGRQQRKKKDIKYGTLMNVFMYLVMGLMYILPLQAIPDRILSLTFYFSLLMLILTFMLITDFSNVLFDARDKYILFPRPVSDRTLVLARMLHIFIYLIRIIIPLGLPGLVLLSILDGWKSALLLPVALTLLVFMALFIVNGLYLLILRLSKPERFKDIINYFQIAASILFFSSIYTSQRLFDVEHPQKFDINNFSWVKFTPPYWLAAMWSWIGYPVTLAGSSLFSSLAIICPLVCMYILVKFLAPQFAMRIAGIDTLEPGGNQVMPQGVKRKKPGTFYKNLADMLNRTDDAKAGFIITWLQTSRSRSFKMRVFPTFAYVPVYFFFTLSNSRSTISEAFLHMGEHPTYLFLLYMTSFAMISALTYLTMSEQYKAAWVFYATPVEIPGRIMIGAFKAIWVKYFLPFFGFISIFVLYIWGPSAIWDVFLALINVTLFISLMARVSFRHLPFSIMEQMKQGGSRIAKSLISMIIPVALGFGHYFSLNLLWLKLLFLCLSSIMLWLVWDSYANTSWANMIKGEME